MSYVSQVPKPVCSPQAPNPDVENVKKPLLQLYTFLKNLKIAYSDQHIDTDMLSKATYGLFHEIEVIKTKKLGVDIFKVKEKLEGMQEMILKLPAAQLIYLQSLNLNDDEAIYLAEEHQKDLSNQREKYTNEVDLMRREYKKFLKEIGIEIRGNNGLPIELSEEEKEVFDQSIGSKIHEGCMFDSLESSTLSYHRKVFENRLNEIAEGELVPLQYLKMIQHLIEEMYKTEEYIQAPQAVKKLYSKFDRAIGQLMLLYSEAGNKFDKDIDVKNSLTLLRMAFPNHSKSDSYQFDGCTLIQGRDNFHIVDNGKLISWGANTLTVDGTSVIGNECLASAKRFLEAVTTAIENKPTKLVSARLEFSLALELSSKKGLSPDEVKKLKWKLEAARFINCHDDLEDQLLFALFNYAKTGDAVHFRGISTLDAKFNRILDFIKEATLYEILETDNFFHICHIYEGNILSKINQKFGRKAAIKLLQFVGNNRIRITFSNDPDTKLQIQTDILKRTGNQIDRQNFPNWLDITNENFPLFKQYLTT